MPNTSVLLLEDDADLRQEVKDYLQMEGCRVTEAGSLREARELLNREQVRAIVLDVGLPDGDGLAALPELRRLAGCPIVMMTAWGQLPQRLQALNNGADYYLVKPVALAELAAVLARLMPRSTTPDSWRCDPDSRVLLSPLGLSLQLTLSEWLFVQALREDIGQLVLRDRLVLALGHDPLDYDPRRMDSLVQRLRSKAQAAGMSALPIHTRHGQGYMWLERRAQPERQSD